MMSYMNLIKINQELNGDIVTDTDTSFSEIRVFQSLGPIQIARVTVEKKIKSEKTEEASISAPECYSSQKCNNNFKSSLPPSFTQVKVDVFTTIKPE